MKASKPRFLEELSSLFGVGFWPKEAQNMQVEMRLIALSKRYENNPNPASPRSLCSALPGSVFATTGRGPRDTFLFVKQAADRMRAGSARSPHQRPVFPIRLD